MTTSTKATSFKLPARFQDFEGTLYRDDKPFRLNYSQGHREIKTVADMKASLRNGPYTWPGGYEVVYYIDDGATLCSDCTRKHFRLICSSIRGNCSDGWHVVGSGYEAVSVECNRECSEDLISTCAHCGKEFGELA